MKNKLYFESKATTTKKIFTVKFPYEVIFSLKWGEEEQELLHDYEASEKVSDKLEMLAMIANKIESEEQDEQAEAHDLHL